MTMLRQDNTPQINANAKELHAANGCSSCTKATARLIAAINSGVVSKRPIKAQCLTCWLANNSEKAVDNG
jgi:hypothetical protein